MGVDDGMGGNWGVDDHGKAHTNQQEQSLRDSFAASVWHGQYVDILDELYACFDTVSGLRHTQNQDGARYVLREIGSLTQRVLPGFPTSLNGINPQKLFEMYTETYEMQLKLMVY